jgi:hypothetical protein
MAGFPRVKNIAKSPETEKRALETCKREKKGLAFLKCLRSMVVAVASIAIFGFGRQILQMKKNLKSFLSVHITIFFEWIISI